MTNGMVCLKASASHLTAMHGARWAENAPALKYLHSRLPRRYNTQKKMTKFLRSQQINKIKQSNFTMENQYSWISICPEKNAIHQ